VDGVSFASLQKGRASKQTAEGSWPVELPDLLSEAVDFADTAAVIKSLDLVITVDTAMAHLAGTMGKPVWILHSHIPNWRWGL
jgi:ADP-heptose:LPS heptosyltransferase